MNLRAPLGSAFTGYVLAHHMPWTGDPSRVSHVTGYRQTDLGVAESQAQCMLASGIDGAVLWWQGPTHTFTHTAFMQMFVACMKGGMAVMVGLDQWIAKGQSNPTQSVIAGLQFLQPYVKFLEQPWILEFDLAAVGVNLAAVQAAIQSLGLTLMSKHVGYSWPETTGTFQTLLNDNAKPTMRVPAIFSRFNDGGYPLPNGVGDPTHWSNGRDYNRSVWGVGPTRIIEARGGRTYLDSCAAVPAGSRYAGLVTWNDYDEGTEHEPECVRATGIKKIGT